MKFNEGKGKKCRIFKKRFFFVEKQNSTKKTLIFVQKKFDKKAPFLIYKKRFFFVENKIRQKKP